MPYKKFAGNPVGITNTQSTTVPMWTLTDVNLQRIHLYDYISGNVAAPADQAALFQLQQDFAAVPPGAVLDGRDIGTVICPRADVKIFVTASAEVRARRRALEMHRLGQVADETVILADIRRRDERDSKRTVAPLKPAPDAHILDTSDLDIDAVLRRAIAIVEEARKSR